MLESINKIIDFVGTGNVITIITFLLCLFAGYYFYYKSFFRLVYSTKTICKTCIDYKDWSNSEKELNTRILIYNNGRKTLSKEQINKIDVICSQKIINIITIKKSEGVIIELNENLLNFTLNYLDSSDFVVIELLHTGRIEINGRVAETGKFLHTEPRNWVIINGVFVISIIVTLFYYMFTLLQKDLWQFIINFVLLFAIFILIRFIHGMLFIPDSLSNKYLEAEDKWNREYKKL